MQGGGWGRCRLEAAEEAVWAEVGSRFYLEAAGEGVRAGVGS